MSGFREVRLVHTEATVGGTSVEALAAFGFRVAWINRFDQGREYLPFGPDAELQSLAEMPVLLGI